MNCTPPKWGLDLRSIALFRVGLAIVFLLNLLERSSGGQLELFFPSRGVLPPEIVSSPLGLSFLDGLSYPTAIGFMIFAGVFGLFLLVGYLTVVSRWVCFVVLVLLAHRFPLFIEGAESSFRLFFLLGCLLPLGDRFSVDSWLRRRRELSQATFWRPRHLEMSLPVFYICLTLAGMYFCNASIKSRSERWWDGRAFQAVVQDVNYSVRPLALLAREYLDVRVPHVNAPGEAVPTIYVVFSRGILMAEALLPFLILLALRFEVFRFLSFIVILGFHGGIWLWMSIGPFSLTLMACSLIFVPSFFYRYFVPEWGLPGAEPAVRRGVFWGRVAPSLCFFSLLPLWLGNPVLKAPFASVLPVVQKYNSFVLSLLYIRQEWMQFKDPRGWSALGFVEVVRGGESDFFLRNRPAHTASEFYREAYWTNQFAHLYLGFVMGNSELRRLLSERLFSEGADRVVFWQFVYSPQGQSSDPPYKRVLVESVVPERRAAFSSLSPGLSTQRLQPFFEPGVRWKFSTQFFWKAREGETRSFSAVLPGSKRKWGVRRASLSAVCAPDYGRFRVAVNGTSIGEVDFYGSHVGPVEVPIVPSLLRPGRNVFSFECLGKSGASSQSFLGVSGLLYEELEEGPSPLEQQAEQ